MIASARPETPTPMRNEPVGESRRRGRQAISLTRHDSVPWAPLEQRPQRRPDHPTHSRQAFRLRGRASRRMMRPTMTVKQRRRLARAAGVMGGAARARVLSPERRREIAQLGAQTRWERHRVEQRALDAIRDAGFRAPWHPAPCACWICVGLMKRPHAAPRGEPTYEDRCLLPR